MTRTEAIALLLCIVIPGAFAVYEMAALTGIAPWHTLSFYAQQNFILDVAIIVLAVLALIGFVAWWIHHMRTRISR